MRLHATALAACIGRGRPRTARCRDGRGFGDVAESCGAGRGVEGLKLSRRMNTHPVHLLVDTLNARKRQKKRYFTVPFSRKSRWSRVGRQKWNGLLQSGRRKIWTREGDFLKNGTVNLFLFLVCCAQWSEGHACQAGIKWSPCLGSNTAGRREIGEIGRRRRFFRWCYRMHFFGTQISCVCTTYYLLQGYDIPTHKFVVIPGSNNRTTS